MNAVRLAGALLKNGVRPVFVVSRDENGYACHLPADTSVRVLDTGDIRSSTLRLMRSVRPLARLFDDIRPDVAIPVMARPALALLAAVQLSSHKPLVVLSVQNTLSHHNRNAGALFNKIEREMIRRMFPRADHVIALSKGVADDLANTVPVLRGRIDVVHNIGLPLPSQISVPEEDVTAPAPGRIRYLACGRLVQQKGYPFLLKAFARVLQTQNAELQILGQGPLKSRLEKLADTLGIRQRVSFMGFRRNPFVYMRTADVFVLSSLWEGFGNVIVEAMAMGTPVIATNCPHGPNEIITDGENGILVAPGNSELLAAGMLRLAADEALRERLARAGRERAGEFSAERIGAQFAGVLRRLALGEQKHARI